MIFFFYYNKINQIEEIYLEKKSLELIKLNKTDKIIYKYSGIKNVYQAKKLMNLI